MDRRGGPPPLARSVLVVAAAVTGGLLLLAGRYGPHRDELYFVSAGDRLAWGYPDQPPLTPAIAALADSVAPGSLTVLRLTSAVIIGLVVVLAAHTARELGGGTAAQFLTAVVVASGAVFLVLGHLLSTATFDLLVWSTILFLAVVALQRDRPRLWLLVGAVAGVGLLNKHLVLVLLGSLFLALLVDPRARHHLRTPWPYAGGAVALALWLPNLLWQAKHGWPQLELGADIREEYSTAAERIGYVALQLLQVSPLATAIWAFGVVVLIRDDRFHRVRPLAWTYAIALVVFAVSGGKAYYLAGLMPSLVAVGAVALEARWPARRMTTLTIAAAAVALVGVPIALPVLPASAFASSPYAAIGEDQAEMLGWPELAQSVREVARDLPDGTVAFTGNYGEAGALEWYHVGLPVYSGHNGFGAWGPPPEGAGPVVVLGYGNAGVDFDDCEQVATVDSGLDLDNEEQGGPIFVCSGPRGGWAAAWPRLTHLDA
ncbi:MAG: glycosyltransferase family 39 protein [Candidatus Nanopelagicales bacterium]